MGTDRAAQHLPLHGPRLLIINETGSLPINRVGAHLFFQPIRRRYERDPMILTSPGVRIVVVVGVEMPTLPIACSSVKRECGHGWAKSEFTAHREQRYIGHSSLNARFRAQTERSKDLFRVGSTRPTAEAIAHFYWQPPRMSSSEVDRPLNEKTATGSYGSASACQVADLRSRLRSPRGICGP
jgi:hypothetical protein